MFCEEIRTKQYLSYISFCPLRILYNSKFIIMAISFGTNSVVVTSVHCNTFVLLKFYDKCGKELGVQICRVKLVIRIKLRDI